MGGFAGFLSAFLMHGPELFSDAEDVFGSIAHGEGGVAKVEKAIGALSHLLGHAQAAIGAAGQVAEDQAQTETDKEP